MSNENQDYSELASPDGRFDAVLLLLRDVSHGVNTSTSAARGCAVSRSAKTQVITQKARWEYILRIKLLLSIYYEPRESSKTV
jgi:hypothetical protein